MDCIVTKFKAVAENPALPVLEIMQQFTYDAITASGNADMTDTQKWALNHFFYELGVFDTSDETIWSRLEFVVLPILALDKNHALIDYKDNSDCMNQTSASNITIQNKGVATLNGNSLIAKKAIGAADIRDISMFIALSSINSDNVCQIGLTNDGTYDLTNSQVKIFRNSYVDSETNQNFGVGKTGSWYYYSSKPSTVIGLSLNSVDGTTTDNSFGYILDGDKAVKVASRISSNSISFDYDANVEVFMRQSPSYNPIQIAVYGKGLTDEQTYKTMKAIINLRSAFFTSNN